MHMSFRYKLSNVINNIRSWRDIERSDMELLEQVTSVMQLSQRFNLSISPVRLARRNDPPSYAYNCFMWAFGLLDRDWLEALMPKARDVCLRPDFAGYLVSHHLQEIDQQEAKTNDVAVYFKDGRPVHAGIWNFGLVISKWGLYSHLWKHGPCELPIEYGDEIRFYRSLPGSTIRKAFQAWLRQRPSAAGPAGPALTVTMRHGISPVLCTDERIIPAVDRIDGPPSS